MLIEKHSSLEKLKYVMAEREMTPGELADVLKGEPAFDKSH